ncbi:lachesin-like [Tubulanus polymorphus]|uniref:lachesin-like n=1 Tax=Tubulanus polymorphus TaxID=672921 RepID=UPI003DA2B378
MLCRFLTILMLMYSASEIDAAQQQSAITKEIEQETRRAGDDGQLECTVTNPEQYPVFWIHMANSGPKYISADTTITLANFDVGNGQLKYEVRTQRVDSNTLYRLIIRALKEEDAGKYRCQIGVPGTDQPYKDGILVVQRSPKIDESRTSKGPVYVREGEDYNLTCVAEGTPQPRITWTRVKGTALPNGLFKVKGNVFALTNITFDHRGVYRCNADNDVRPPAQQDIEVKVYFHPRPYPFRTSVGQMPDKNYKAELDCLVEGFPEPEIQWAYLENDFRKMITKDSKHDIFETKAKGPSKMKDGDIWSTLVIRNVQSGDYGTYICQAKSNLGTYETRIKLYYTPTCQGALCPMETVGLSSSGQTTISILMLLASIVSSLRFMSV